MTTGDARPDPVLAAAEAGDPLSPVALRDLMGEAFSSGATTVAIPVGRLDPQFFDLRSGVAGDLVQLFVNYRMRLAIVGDLPTAAMASRSFQAFMHEANRGSQTWFLPSLEAVRERLQREPG